MKYTVHFTQTSSVSVTVDADDPQEAIELAYDEAPADICAMCSGWNHDWSREIDGELEVSSVTNDDGETVYTERET